MHKPDVMTTSRHPLPDWLFKGGQITNTPLSQASKATKKKSASIPDRQTRCGDERERVHGLTGPISQQRFTASLRHLGSSVLT